MVVARLTSPLTNIKAKKDTRNSKACMTNQYFPVSSNQITTDVKKTIKTLPGERREARPSRNLFINSTICLWKRWGSNFSINHRPIFAVICGSMAEIRKTIKAPKKIIVPQIATVWILPRNPESEVSFASSGRFTNTNAIITTASKIRSTMIVAKEADKDTFSRRLRMNARNTSPARAGKILFPA